MKLKECLQFGKDLGLKTVEEAILNVDYHAMNIFTYDKIAEELNELFTEYNSLYEANLMNAKTFIEDALEICESRE